MQPFVTEERQLWSDPLWPELRIRRCSDHLMIDTSDAATFETLSSAVTNGGYTLANRFVNWQVPLDYDCTDPEAAMREQCGLWGYNAAATVGLQTAAAIKHCAVTAEVGNGFRLVTAATVGLRNRARAGAVRTLFDAYEPGTINVFVLLDARLRPAAYVHAAAVVAEAKAAALQDLDIRDQDGRVATGTTTDSLVIAAAQHASSGYEHRYAGTATTIGDAIARSVYRTISEAGATQARPRLNE